MKLKNKLLLIIGIVLFSLCTMDVKAGTEADYKGTIAKLSLTKSIKEISIPSLGRVYSADKVIGNFTFFNLTVNGYASNKALCLDSGKNVQPSHSYVFYSVVKAPIAKQIYQYLISSNTSDTNILAQIAAWVYYYNEEGVNWGDKSEFIKSYTQFVYSKAIAETLVLYEVKLVGFSSKKIEEMVNSKKSDLFELLIDFGGENEKDNLIFQALVNEGYYEYALTSRINAAKKLAGSVYDSINQGKVAQYSGDLCIYIGVGDKYPGNEYQRFMAPCAKPVDVTVNPSCVNSSGTTVDLTSCVNTCTSKGTEESSCLTTCSNTYCPSSNLLYGEVETVENYKTCSEGGDDVIQGNTYEYYNATKVVAEKTDLASGEFVKNIGSYCAVYCLEDTAEVFPGNVNTPVGVGSYLIWPTSAATANSIYSNDYSLELKGTKACHIELAYGGTEYDKYINTTNDPVADVTTLYSQAAAASGKYPSNANGLSYETYRINTTDGKNCDYGIFAGTCSSDRTALEKALSSHSLDGTSYNNINDLYNKMKSIADDTSYYSGVNGVKDALDAAAAAAAKEARGEIIDPSSARWRKEAEDRQAKHDVALGDAQNAFNSAAGINASNWASIVTEISALQTTYSACTTALAACNSYATKVQEAIKVANDVVNCANYDFTGTEKEIYNWETYLNVSWADKEYGTTLNEDDLEKTTTVTCENCTGIGMTELPSKTKIGDIVKNTKDIIKAVSEALPNRQIAVHYDTAYSLPTTGNLLYNYVNKKTLKAVTDISAAGDNYITIGYSNMPISYEADVGVRQPLSITDISFGSDGKYKGIDYVCSYEVSEVTSSCICPEGTLHAGENLVCMLSDNDMSCADAQAAFCDSTSIVDFDTTCDKFCPNDASIDLTACMSAGMSYDDCAATLCDDTYRCKNSNNVGGYMDITACVQTKVAQGSTITEAVNICDATVCPLSGIKIIYRTISLANPFPGKDVSGIVSGFNTTIKGRYPGVNWNSKTLVNKLILDNRGVSDNSVYQAEPLYTFVLTPEVIKEIRSYNDANESSGGYADYTLDCKSNNSTACVSDFVHNSIYGLAGGTCSDATGKNTFYQCTN